MSQKSYDGTPTLYLVPTPIGNLGDMTYRGVEILNNSEVIFSNILEDKHDSLEHFSLTSLSKRAEILDYTIVVVQLHLRHY